MMNKQAIQSLYDYHYGMWDNVWDCVLELTEEQFVAESDYSWRSVRNHLVHAISTDNRWLARVKLADIPTRLEPADYPNYDLLREKWNQIRDDVLAYLNSIGDDDLQEIITVELPHRNVRFQHKRWEILAHVVNHGTDHRAQILARLHELGAMTVEQDMILYWWAQQGF